MPPTTLADLPTELLSAVAGHVFAAGRPAPPVSLDPVDPSSSQPGHWSEPVARKTLASMCLVNHACCEAAKPWLWRHVPVRLPRSWLALLEQTLEPAGYDGEEEPLEYNFQPMAAAVADIVSADPTATPLEHIKAVLPAVVESSAVAGTTWPLVSISPDLLSPPASRDPSPRRLRGKSQSPPRWKVIRSLNLIDRTEPAFHIPTPPDPRPGRHVEHLDFNHFRTIGMRRSVEEGVKSRFVTGDRLEAVLKEMPSLLTFGATEYMDGALTLPVLKELFLRGTPSGARGRSLRSENDDDDRERLREFRELEAVDLTGCVSGVFVRALTDFVGAYITPGPVVLPGLRRLGLRGVTSVPADVLHALVLAAPSLTHLDLSCTRITSQLLEGLSGSPIRLESLSLERCSRLSGESLASFLINAPAAHGITELNLYGDHTFPSPLTEEQLGNVLSQAPCFTRGQLVYVDLSSAPFTPTLLLNVFPPQPRLRSLGLAHLATLPLGALRDFVRTKAAGVEVLAMAGTSPELGYAPILVDGQERRQTMQQATMAVHIQLVGPLCTPPPAFSWRADYVPKPPPTRLRVIELAMPLLTGLHAGANSWRVVRSKGGRGWYVDTASGWVKESPGGESVLRRDLPTGHSVRTEMERLADANGNVSSGVGWHARKMEVLYGHGMLGREDGLYGAVSFAYQG